MGEEERRRCCIIADAGCCIEYLTSAPEDRERARHQAMMEELLSYWPAEAGNPSPGVLKALAAGLLKNFGFTTPAVAQAMYQDYRMLFQEALKAG